MALVPAHGLNRDVGKTHRRLGTGRHGQHKHRLLQALGNPQIQGPQRFNGKALHARDRALKEAAIDNDLPGNTDHLTLWEIREVAQRDSAMPAGQCKQQRAPAVEKSRRPPKTREPLFHAIAPWDNQEAGFSRRITRPVEGTPASSKPNRK